MKVRKVVPLSDCRSSDIEGVLLYMLAEIDGCDSSIMPKQRPVFVAMAFALDSELRLRDPRRKPLVTTDANPEKP